MERDLERKFRQACEAQGWKCWKLTVPGLRGVPDRLVVKHGSVFFVELKTKRGRLSVHQRRRTSELKNLQHNVYVVRDETEIEEVIQCEISQS